MENHPIPMRRAAFESGDAKQGAQFAAIDAMGLSKGANICHAFGPH
jgi:hypothetical protein